MPNIERATGPERIDTVPLSKEQQKATDFIKRSLEESKTQSPILLITGLPGVGKSTAIETLTPDITRRGGKSIPHVNNILYERELQEDLFSHQGPVVISTTPVETQEIQKNFSHREIHTHITKGMTHEEMRKLLTDELQGGKHTLELENLISLTMGNPRLGKLLAREPHMTETTAIELAVSYYTNFMESLNRMPDALPEYITIPPNSEIVDGYRNYKQSDYPTPLPRIFERRMDSEKRTGIREVSPEFVDPQTLTVYKNLQNRAKEMDNSFTDVSIFIPALSPEKYDVLEQHLGLSMKRLQKQRPVDALSSSRRATMFNLSGGKLSIVSRIGERQLFREAGQVEEVREKKMHEQFKEGNLPLKPTDASQSSLFLVSNDHPGLWRNPLVFGHMIESLLQQLGIGYIAEHELKGAMQNRYWYEPNEQRIKPFTIPKE